MHSSGHNPWLNLIMTKQTYIVRETKLLDSNSPQHVAILCRLLIRQSIEHATAFPADQV
jgi:hypothetical protein